MTSAPTSCNPPRPSYQDDRGSVSVLVAVLVPALLLVLAVVVDGADRLRAHAHAEATAAEAARAALTAVNTRGPTVTVDRSQAAKAARAYLARTHTTGEVHLTGTESVSVSVQQTVPARIGLLGTTHHVTGRAQAELVVDTR